MGVILYVTTKQILVPLMGLPDWSTPYACVGMGLVTVVYTSLGGLRAVIITDVIQAFILFGGAILTLIVITVSLGGVEKWWPMQWMDHWDTFNLGVHSDSRVTVLEAALAGLIWWICTAGSDQIAIQRYLATRDAHAARGALAVSLLAGFLSVVILAMVGLALSGYFHANQNLLPDEITSTSQDGDKLFPHFIVVGLPTGITGLVIAGLLAAAMSSLSSGINSSCTVIAVDFIDRLGRPGELVVDHVRRTKAISWVVGILTVMSSTLVGYIEGNLIEVTYKAVNLLVAPLFLLFYMAMFIPWATPFGAVTAATVSAAVAIGVAYFGWFGLSFIWIVPISFSAGAVAGPLASLLRTRSTDFRK